jgi:hypothetical protein
MVTHRSIRFFLAVLATLLIGGACYASSITVNNYSFETQPGSGQIGCGSGCDYTSDQAPPDWSVITASEPNPTQYGQLEPGSPDNEFVSVPDGVVVAYSNGPMLYQTVSATVQAGLTYTLTVYLGSQYDYPFTASADLLIGPTPTSGTQYFAVGTQPAAGNFAIYTATYVAQAGDVGDDITIQLNATGAQGDYDDVVLSSATPEPALMGLTGLALCGLGLFLRRKRIAA